MNTLTTPTRITLNARELMALDQASDVRIECLSGELWITTDGGAGDLILVAGDKIQLKETPRAFISALRSANFIATPCAGQSPVRQFATRCAAKFYDAYRRWQHAPLANYPALWLR